METLECSRAVTTWALLCPGNIYLSWTARTATALSATLYLVVNDGNTSLVVQDAAWAIKVENGN